MLRIKPLRAGAYALLTITAISAVSLACFDTYFPISSCGTVDKDKLYDGIWIMERINGSLLPTNDPTDPTRRINAGSLTFKTNRIYGSCDAVRYTLGKVTGTVGYTQAGATNNRTAGADYRGDHMTTPKGVTLENPTSSATGTVIGDVMTFTNVQDARFVLANKGVATITFRRF